MARKLRLGEVVGKLTVVGFEREGLGTPYARVKCSCGSAEKLVSSKSLKAGKTNSCGCLCVGNITHGKVRTKVYSAWKNMHTRVKTLKRYKLLGVDERWKKFENFYSDMGDLPFVGATLERIDNERGYSKENCKWATRKEQQANRSTTVWLTVNGTSKPASTWAEERGLNTVLVVSRVARGITGERALSPTRLESTGPKVGRTQRLFTNGQQQLKMVELAKLLGIAKSTCSWRADKGSNLGGYYEIPLPETQQ